MSGPGERLTLATSVRAFPRDVWLALAASCAVQFGFGGVYSLLLNLALQRLGYPIEFMGLVNAAIAAGFALLAIPAGSAGAWWGCRKMLALGIAAGAASSLALPFCILAPSAFRGALIIATYGVFGASLTLCMVNGLPIMAAVPTDESRVYVFTVYTASTPFATFLGSIAAGVLPGLLSRARGLSLGSAAPYALSLLVVPAVLLLCALLFPVLRGPDATARRGGSALGDGSAPVRLLVLASAFVVLRGGITWGYFTYLSIYLDSVFAVPVATIGLVAAAGRLLPGFTTFTAPGLGKRFGDLRLSFLLSVAAAAMTLPSAFAASPAAATFSFITTSILGGVQDSLFGAWRQSVCPVPWRPLLAGCTMCAQAVAMILVAYGGGRVIGTFGYRSFFMLIAAVTLASALVLWRFLPKRGSSSATPTTGR